ncbi:MAG: c-type cytochrome [Sphingomonadaceae bacterium]
MNPKHVALMALPLLAACGASESNKMTQEVERGAIVFERVCQACHILSDEARIGPGLKGVVGRPIASVDAFAYSEAMLKDKGSGVWTPERIKSYVMGPMQMYPEGRMVMEPLSPKDANAVVAYLQEYP